MTVTLALEDGTYFTGKGFGAACDSQGEVVFNTSMSGYQEILTDPSYNGQIVCMTYPEIGNYGINEEDVESSKIQVGGFIVKNLCDLPSNYRSLNKNLDTYLKDNNIPGIMGIDTRMLVKKLRSEGAMRGVILKGEVPKEEAVSKAKSVKSIVGADLVKNVTTDSSYIWEENIHSLQPSSPTENDGDFNIVCVDFGVKYNTLRRLKALGADVTVVPATFSPSQILDLDPDGVYLSNGPGDPQAVSYGIETVKELLDHVPIFGICLGHQILSLALGARTFKLKFGHRGANHPIKNLATGEVEITSQNHGFAVQKGTLPEKNGKVTHINLNDDTVAGIEHATKPVFSIQYHPEASPGPHDSYYLFEKFAKNARKFQSQKKTV